MQKLPEVSDRKKGTSRQWEQTHSLTGSDWQIDNTLLTGSRRHAYVFGRGVG